MNAAAFRLRHFPSVRLGRRALSGRIGTRLALGAALGFAAAAPGAGCSLALSFEQCASDQDCANLDGGSYSCQAGVCVAQDPTGASTSTTDATDTDPSATGTTDTSSTSSTTGTETESETDPTTGNPGECTVNSDCAGTDRLCTPANTCVSLASLECPTVVWPDGADRDQVQFIGSLLPIADPIDPFWTARQSAVQLAVEDFNAVADLQDGRKIGWVACDTTGASTAAATAAAQHLISTLQLPVVIGPGQDRDVLDVAATFATTQTLGLAPFASLQAAETLADNGTIWRGMPSDRYQARALSQRVLDIAPRPARTVVFSADSDYGRGLLAEARRDIEDWLGASTVAFVTYPDPRTAISATELRNTIRANVDAAYAANPGTELVVMIGGPELEDAVTKWVGDVQVDDPSLATLPKFLLTHRAHDVIVDAVAAHQPESERPLVMAAIEVLIPAINDGSAFAEFATRYGTRFAAAPPYDAGVAYDVTMAALLGLAAQPAGPLTGASTIEAMGALLDPSGTAVTFGGEPSTWLPMARQRLGLGGTLDVTGVSSGLDFATPSDRVDPEYGELREEYLLLRPEGLPGMPNVPQLVVFERYVYDVEPPSTDGNWELP